jgi:hypothetical protein
LALPFSVMRAEAARYRSDLCVPVERAWGRLRPNPLYRVLAALGSQDGFWPFAREDGATGVNDLAKVLRLGLR